MGRKRHSAEEIVNVLRLAEVERGKGMPIASVCKTLGVTERWREHCNTVRAHSAPG